VLAAGLQPVPAGFIRGTKKRCLSFSALVNNEKLLFSYLCRIIHKKNKNMTQLIFKSDIDQSKIDILLSMIKSWNIDATVEKERQKPAFEKPKALTLSVGLWKDRDITDGQLREMAWGTAKIPGK
jgi:hypothetical protein